MKTPLSPLGSVASFVRGVTYKPEDLVENFSAGSLVCMRTANIQTDLDQTNLKSIPMAIVKSPEKRLVEGDILVSTANSWNLVGKCCWVPALDYDAVPGGFITALRANREHLEPRYLYHWFNSPRTQDLARNCGRQTTSISNMDLNRCLAIQIPLPSLTEQRRIAAILDQADALRSKRRKAIAKLDLLLESVFLEMFGNLDLSWHLSNIGNLTEIQGGLQVSAARQAIPTKSPYLRVANVYRGRLDLSEIKEIGATPSEVVRTRLQEDDLLVVEGHGNQEEIGRCALWRGDVKNCIHQNHLIRVRVSDARLRPEFLESYLNSTSGRRHLISSARTTTGLNTISTKKVAEVPLRVPPMETQMRWERLKQSIRLRSQAQTKQLLRSDQLFASLQSSLFATD